MFVRANPRERIFMMQPILLLLLDLWNAAEDRLSSPLYRHGRLGEPPIGI